MSFLQRQISVDPTREVEDDEFTTDDRPDILFVMNSQDPESYPEYEEMDQNAASTPAPEQPEQPNTAVQPQA
jgi:hypothetical protein